MTPWNRSGSLEPRLVLMGGIEMERTQRRLRQTLLAAAIGVACVAGLAGCSTPPAEATRVNFPATIEAIEGTDVERITVTDRGAERLGLETVTVETGPSGLQVPYSSLLYDASGQTWVYTNPETLVYIREAVTVDHIDGDLVHLTDGPEAGTSIVTVGAAELFGAELDTEN
jgi:hypothetical protein